MADRLYRPGSRNPKFRSDGRMSKNRVAWLKTFVGQFVMMRYPNDEQPEGEPVSEEGPSYVLILPRRGARPLTFNITALTLEELEMTRRFFNELFDLAEPIVRHRDKVAQNAADEGDDSYARYYREIPQYVIREGELRSDDQGVLDRLADLSLRDRGVLDPDGGLRGGGSELAPGESSETESEDDGQTPD